MTNGSETKMTSSDQIPMLMEITSRRSWIPIFIFIGLSLWIIGYMLIGKIPVTAKGNAIFLTPETIIPFQSTASGRIGKWYVKVGDHVKKGQLLVDIQQPVIEKDLEQAREQLVDMEEKNKTIESFTRVYIELEKDAIDKRKKMLIERIKELKDQISRSKRALESIWGKKFEYIEQNEKDLMDILKLNEKRAEELEKKFELFQDMKTKGLRSEDELLRVKQETINQKDSVSSFNLQLMQLKHKRIKEEELYLTEMNSITKQEESVGDLEIQLEELLSRKAQLDEQYTSSTYGMKLEASDVRRSIDGLQKELVNNSEIHSEYDGRILELTAGEGKIVNKGQMLGSIDTSSQRGDNLQAVAYFELSDGKKITRGMKLRLIPATVESTRFGSLIARVRSVSSFPITTEAAARVVGNSSVAQSLTEGGHQIEVFADLLRDETTFSGYKWDLSGGPETEVTSGTIASALVNIKEKPPITFVIPILDEWSGFGAKDTYSDSGDIDEQSDKKQ